MYSEGKIFKNIFLRLFKRMLLI